MLQGRTALVTGGARGLGRSYVLRLASRGAQVAVADINLHSFDDYALEREAMTGPSVAEEVRKAGGKAIEFTVDVTDSDAVTATVAETVSEFGQLDIVVCNAGGGSGEMRDSAAGSLKQEDLIAVLNRNLLGTIYTCRAVTPVMMRQKSGKIITVSSIAGLNASADGTYSHYGTAKAGIAMYTRYLAHDLGPHGITANCIAPGMVGTGRMMERFKVIGVENIEQRIPVGRIGTPEDIAKVVEFLAGDLSDYVNGAVIPVDGGVTA